MISAEYQDEPCVTGQEQQQEQQHEQLKSFTPRTSPSKSSQPSSINPRSQRHSVAYPISFAPSLISIAPSTITSLTNSTKRHLESGVSFKYYRGNFEKCVDFMSLNDYEKEGTIRQVELDKFSELKYFMGDEDIEGSSLVGKFFFSTSCVSVCMGYFTHDTHLLVKRI